MQRNSRTYKLTVRRFNLSQSIGFLSLRLSARDRAPSENYLFINLINELWVRHRASRTHDGDKQYSPYNDRMLSPIELQSDLKMEFRSVFWVVCCEGARALAYAFMSRDKWAIGFAQKKIAYQTQGAEVDIDSEAMINKKKTEHTWATATGFVCWNLLVDCGFDASLFATATTARCTLTHALRGRFFPPFWFSPSAQWQRFRNHLSLWICVTVAAAAIAIFFFFFEWTRNAR